MQHVASNTVASNMLLNVPHVYTMQLVAAITVIIINNTVIITSITVIINGGFNICWCLWSCNSCNNGKKTQKEEEPDNMGQGLDKKSPFTWSIPSASKRAPIE